MSPFSYDSIFRTALLIRTVEERVAEIYPSDKIQSPVHLSLGQEHHVAALCAALDQRDALFSSYRCHAAYIARGAPLTPFFAELFGRSTGVSGGKAGSMHLTAPAQNMLGSSGIVAAVIPHAAGFAYGYRLKRQNNICVSLTGDGSTEEGVFFETLNLAKLRNAPHLLVIEQNDWAVNTRRHQRQGFRLSKLADAFDIPYEHCPDGFDFEAVFSAARRMRAKVAESSGPAILEIGTCRYADHVGVNESTDEWSRAEVKKWRSRDPLLLDQERRQKFLPAILEEVAQAVTEAERSPMPGAEVLLRDVIE